MQPQHTLNTSEIRTLADFRTYVKQLSREAQNSPRSLEEYLSALLLLVQVNRQSSVLFAQIAQILSEALTSPIAPFDTIWLRFKRPPAELGQRGPIDDDFSFSEKMLLYQIADLLFPL